MVMSVKEQITELEENIDKLKGPGSKEKRKDLQAKIDALKEIDDEVAGDNRNDKIDAIIDKKIADKGGIPEYRPVTMDQVKKAEKECKLVGFDPENMTASIRE